MTIFSNKELAAKLETVEALNQVEFALTYNKFFREPEAAYKKIGSGYAVYTGQDSPLTQAFGMGLQGVVSEDEVAELEDFYRQVGAAVNVEVCHHSDMSLTNLLMDRGYRISEYSNVLLKPLGQKDRFDTETGIRVRQVEADEIELFAEVVARGFAEGNDPPQMMKDLFKVYCHQSNCTSFAAFHAGEAAGGGSVFMRDGVAVFGGASTLPDFRNRGVQTELLRQRLKVALAEGCDLAMVTTSPGSASQRNMEKQGFQVVYARTKFSRS